MFFRKKIFFGALLLCATASYASLKITYQFRETSFFFRDMHFVDATHGWAVGPVHWSRQEKRVVATILKTEDGGDGWTVQAAPAAKNLRAVAFANERCGWAAGKEGTLLRTDDGGENWEAVTFPVTEDIRDIWCVDSQAVFVASIRPVHFNYNGDADDWRASIWKSADGGENWAKQNISENAAIINKLFFVSDTQGWAAGIRYAGENSTQSPRHRGAIYRTLDGGANWTLQDVPPVPEAFPMADSCIVFNTVFFADSQNGWAGGFKRSSAAEGSCIYRTIDGGEHWAQIEEETFASANIQDIRFLDALRGYAVGTLYGAAWGPPVMRTIDGGLTWEKVAMEKHDGEGLYCLQVTEDAAIAAGDHDFICVSTDPWGEYGWPWGENLFTQRYCNAHYTFQDIHFVDSMHGWACGQKIEEPKSGVQIIVHTNNGGQSWETQYISRLSQVAGTPRLNKFFFINADTGFCVGSDGFVDELAAGILKTVNGGSSWENKSPAEITSEYFSVWFTDRDNGWALANASDELTLARTADGGESWQRVGTGIENTLLGIGFANVQGDIVFADQNHGYITGGLGVIAATDDGGMSWQRRTLSCGYGSCPLRCFAIAFQSPDKGFIAGEGLYVTRDTGENWLDAGVESSVWGNGDLHDIDFPDPMHGWIVGNSGQILRSEDGGDSWSNPDTSVKVGATLYGGSFIDSVRGWVSGTQGTIAQVNYYEEVVRNAYSPVQRNADKSVQIRIHKGNMLTIDWGSSPTRVLRATLFNLNGAALRHIDAKGGNREVAVMDLSALSSGIYTLRIGCRDECVTRNIVLRK